MMNVFVKIYSTPCLWSPMLFKHLKHFLLEVGKTDDRHFRVESEVILHGSASTWMLKLCTAATLFNVNYFLYNYYYLFCQRSVLRVFYYELRCSLFFMFMIKSPSVWLSRCSGVDITGRSTGSNQSHGPSMIRPISSVWAAGQTCQRRCSSPRLVGACPFSVRDWICFESIWPPEVTAIIRWSCLIMYDAVETQRDSIPVFVQRFDCF